MVAKNRTCAGRIRHVESLQWKWKMYTQNATDVERNALLLHICLPKKCSFLHNPRSNLLRDMQVGAITPCPV